MAVEAALAFGPLAAALLVSLTAGLITPGGVGLSLLVGAAAAFAIAYWRVGTAERFRRWLTRAGRSPEQAREPGLAGPLASVAAPAIDLVRRLRSLERRIHQLDQRFADLVTTLPDPILVLDRQLTIRLANPAADKTFGLELTGVPLGRALRDPGVLAAINAALANGSTSGVTFSPAADRTKLFSAGVTPISVDRDGTGVLLVLRELTEQVLIERMRSDFVANASHEIRTPLASIIGIVETLRGPARDDAAAREMFLGTMADDALRMQRLVDDLLFLSRIELAAHRPPEKAIDPVHIVREVVQRVTPLAEQARIELEARIEPDLPRVRADADQLHQLLLNLLDNAIKYSPAGKQVRLEVRHLGAAPASTGALSGRPCILLAVRDQGEGIAPEHLARVTERFYRVDKARSRKVGGTGLGLAIVKHIVRRHQGHLEIESVPGRGSLFSVYLPLAAPPDA
jgi:two-component system, OmpR family, phosphate regulon sensor histidine kinase PhoR